MLVASVAMAVVLTDAMTGFGTDFESFVDFDPVFEIEFRQIL